jgi:fatty acid desaturase
MKLSCCTAPHFVYTTGMTHDDSLQRINWYRTPVERALLAQLNQRSDARGLLQTLGHLGVIACTAALSFYASLRWPWWALLICLFLHGTVYAFLLNGFHELCHSSVFKTKSLNSVFLAVFSFMSGNNPIAFWASHQEHHKFTLHPPDDLEVVLPVQLSLVNFLKYSFVNPWGLWERTKHQVRTSRGELMGDWEQALFERIAPEKKGELVRWARTLLFGHLSIAAVSLALGLWQIPLLLTLAPFYGGLALYLCNNTQHIGLQDEVEDYRLCVRTIYINPIFQFLYWHMNYHTEHHMYAAVPCYNLARLHAAIKHDLPPCPNGLLPTWTLIIDITRKQKTDPAYQYEPLLPA